MHTVSLHSLDPETPRAEGFIAEGNLAYQQLKRRDTVALPVEPGLVEQSGISGYAVRKFGKGADYDKSHPTRAVKVTLLVNPNHSDLHVVVRIEAVEGRAPSGNLTFTNDTTQPGSRAAMVRDAPMIQLDKLGPPDIFGGWTILQEIKIEAPNTPIIAGYCLHGIARGVVVKLLGVSQT